MPRAQVARAVHRIVSETQKLFFPTLLVLLFRFYIVFGWSIMQLCISVERAGWKCILRGVFWEILLDRLLFYLRGKWISSGWPWSQTSKSTKSRTTGNLHSRHGTKKSQRKLCAKDTTGRVRHGKEMTCQWPERGQPGRSTTCFFDQ